MLRWVGRLVRRLRKLDEPETEGMTPMTLRVRQAPGGALLLIGSPEGSVALLLPRVQALTLIDAVLECIEEIEAPAEGNA